MLRKFFNKPFEFLLYKTNRLHFSVRVYCNRSQKTSQRVKNNSHATRLRLVPYFLFFTRCEIICGLLQYTYTEKSNLFVKWCTQQLQCSYISFNVSLYNLLSLTLYKHFLVVIILFKIKSLLTLNPIIIGTVSKVNFPDIMTNFPTLWQLFQFWNLLRGMKTASLVLLKCS